MPKRVAVGLVTGAKMAKTRRVEIPRTVRHPKYGKFVKQKTVCYVHDEQNESGHGDMVEIIESRPLSKLKRWALVRVVSKSTAVDVAAMREARKAEAAVKETSVKETSAKEAPAKEDTAKETAGSETAKDAGAEETAGSGDAE